MKDIRKRIVKEIDRNLAILGLVASIIFIIFSVFTWKGLGYIVVAILTLLSCIIWLRIRENINLHLKQDFQSKRIFLISNTFFSLFLLGSLLSFHFRSNLYERPLLYFIFIFLMIGTVSLEIFFSPKKNLFYGIILGEIILIGLNITYSQNLLFSSVIGVDPWAHQMLTNNILEYGRIQEMSQYSKIPLFHLEIASTAIINDLNYKIAALLSSHFLIISLNAIMIFLLGRFFFSQKVGLMGGLVLITANYHLKMSFEVIPNSIGAVFILPILYLMFRYDMKKDKFIFFIVLLFMINILLTHTIVSMATAIILLFGWLSFKIYKDSNKTIFKNPIGLTIPLLFISSMVTWWSFISGHILTLFHIIQMGFSRDVFIIAPEKAVQYADTIPFMERLFNNFGFYLFFSISFIGIFYMISKKYGNAQKFSFAIIGGIILVIAFFPLLIGKTVIQNRWFYFSQILLALPIAIAVFLIIDNFKNKNIKPIFLCIFCVILSVLMVMSPSANIDNPILSPNTGVRLGYYESEIIAASFISEKSIINMYSDYDYFTNPSSSIPLNYFNISDKRIFSLDKNLLDGKFDNISGIVVVRDEIVNEPFRLQGTIFRLNYYFYDKFDKINVSKIYLCDSVSIYYK